MAQSLPAAAKRWLDGREFVTLGTIEPDGQPQLSVVWAARDGDELLFSTVRGRRKQRNLERDPRASALVFPRDDPYSYLEVRGTVTLTTDGGRELIDALSEKYEGVRPYTGDGPDAVRLVVRLTPQHVVFRG